MVLMKKINLDSPATKRDLEKLVSRKEFRRAIARLATKEELKKLATKKELKKLATKEELKKLATKEELKKLATKEELKKLATKEELKRLEERLRLEIRFSSGITEEKIKEEFNKKLTETESRILEAIDDFAKEIEASREERTIVAYQTERDRKMLEDHDRRIKSLEQKVFASP